MKRHSPCPLLALGCALALAACTAAGAPQPSPAPDAQTPDTAEAANAPEPGFTVGELYTLPYLVGGGRGFNTGDAYYEIARWGDDLEAGLVLKTDYATKTQTCLCQKPGCTHDSEDCPAYLPRWSRFGLFVVDDVVYLYYSGYSAAERAAFGDDYDAYLAAQKADAVSNDDPGYLDYLNYLETLTPEQYAHDKVDYELNRSPSFFDVIAPDGQGGLSRRHIPLPDELDWDAYLNWCDGKALYGNISPYREDWTPESAGVRISLEDGSVQHFPLLADEIIVACQGSRLLTSRVVFDEPAPTYDSDAYTAALQNAQVEFDWLAPATGERAVFFTLPTNPVLDDHAGFLGLYDGKAVFQDLALDDAGNQTQHSYFYLDPATGDATPITQDTPQRDMWGPALSIGVTPVQKNESWRYFVCQHFISDPVATQDHLLDLDTGEWHKVSQQLDYYGTPMSATVHAVTNDGRWLVACKTHSSTYNDRMDYGLIDPEAFLQGSEDYALIEMYP